MSSAEKKRIRALCAGIWAELSLGPVELGRAMGQLIKGHSVYREAGSLFCFYGVPPEPDTSEIIASALAEGKKTALPRCGRNGFMEARLTGDLSQLERGLFGILQPPAESQLLEPKDIDLVLLPCLACDLNGTRLGRGGGYYDRFLAGLAAPRAALCPERLLFERLPREKLDEAVDYIVTESRIIDTRGARP